ncbi:MAG: GNAT family N-acetyltransferase [Chloroflexi bacterium]|nr:MAG: GNAT family N-acetyltransferase [Chloroflexota bacterium]
MPYSANHVRLLTSSDALSVERLLRTSEYAYQRFTLDELPLTLKRYPTVGVFHNTSLRGFLLSQVINPPSAWIGGFGVGWGEHKQYIALLDLLLEELVKHLLTRRVHYLHYSGTDVDQDWLRSVLLVRGFQPYRYLHSYDKFGYDIPTNGNQQVIVRPVRLLSESGKVGDMAALLAIEAACFDDLWRHDATAFADIATTNPYFVVAELDGQVVGYQFNTVESDDGYLIRIAVHPSVGGQGIGARLMAEAIRFFAEAGASHILLNTQDDNVHAHRLYERFGFIRLRQRGFVLRKNL